MGTPARAGINRERLHLRYTCAVSRTAIIQARVRPEIKLAGECVLKGLGLTMTELMELALRRLIIDQKLPFEPTVLSDRQLAKLQKQWRTRR